LPEQPPAYTPDWAESLQSETLLMAARRHFSECAVSDILPGDLLLFRVGPGLPVKHCAILTAPDQMIHAYWSRAVCETRLVPWWQKRLAAGFRFPALGCDRSSADKADHTLLT